VANELFDDEPARPAVLHDPQAAEQAQLVGNVGLAQVQQRAQVTNAQLLGPRQGVQQAQPGRVRQGGEDRGKARRVVGTEEGAVTVVFGAATVVRIVSPYAKLEKL